MEFTFHNSYIILELVPSTVIFWTELNSLSLHESCSSKARLLLQNSTVVITIRLTNEISISQMTMDIFMWRLLPDFTIWVTCPVSSEKQELLTFREHLGSPWFLVWTMLLIFLVICVVLCFFLRPVSCVPNVASVSRSGMSFLDCPLGFL
jgi:hypothetical protein